MPKELSIKSNMLWNSVGAFTYSLCQWVMTVLVVRLSSGYDAAGMLALAMAVSNVYAPIAMFKVRQYQVSDVNGEIPAGAYVGYRLATIGAGMLVICIYMLLTCPASAYLTIVLYLVFRTIGVFLDVLYGVEQQHMRMDYCGQSMFIRGVLMLAVFAAALSTTNSLDVAIVAMIVFTAPVMLLDFKRSAQFGSIKPTLSKAQARRLFLDCLPAVVGVACCNTVVTVARQYLQFTDGVSALGIYASVCTPVVIIQAVSHYIYAPLIGPFAKHYRNHDRAGFFKLLAQATAGMLAVFAAGAVGFVFLGEWFLGLVFGESIVPYAYLLQPAILMCAAAALVSFFGDLLIAVRSTFFNLVANVVGLAVSLPTTYFFVGAFDMNGASFSVATAYGLTCVLMVYLLFRKMSSGPAA